MNIDFCQKHKKNLTGLKYIYLHYISVLYIIINIIYPNFSIDMTDTVQIITPMVIVTRAATQKHVAGMVWTVPQILLPSWLMVHWWSWCCCSPRSFWVTLRVSCALWGHCCIPTWDLSWMSIRDLWCTHTMEMRKTKCKTILPLWSNVENESWRGRLLGMFLTRNENFVVYLHVVVFV